MAEKCARGCVRARQHLETCEGGDCKGCKPREAEYGLLCYGCHMRLANMLQNAYGQHLLLQAVVEPSVQQDLAQETIAHNVGPRVSSSAPLYMRLAARTSAAEASEPLRVAAADSARQLSDILSAWVEMLATQHRMHGPSRVETAAQRLEGTHGHWRTSRWDLLVIDEETGEREDPEWVWSEPPLLFAVKSAATWLLAQLALLESCPGIGDLWGELAEIMSQAHALAPWREQAASLGGIECPCCHRMTLRLYGGDEDVTCDTCKEVIPWERYAIWVKILTDRAAS